MKRTQATKNWYNRNRVSENARSRAYYAANKKKIALVMARRHYIRLYGITIADRDIMLAAQGNVCAACGSPEHGNSLPGWGWATDHNHKTGKVRGIICCSCNLTLGNAREDTKRLRLLALYLERHYDH
jgi:hypothetical protein